MNLPAFRWFERGKGGARQAPERAFTRRMGLRCGSRKGQALEEFPSFLRKAREILERAPSVPGPEDFRELLCGDCPFYHHGEEENEECGSYRLLRSFLEKGAVDLGALLKALE